MRQKMRYFLLLVGLLLSVSIGAQTVKWRDIYTVKKKDTIFGRLFCVVLLVVVDFLSV